MANLFIWNGMTEKKSSGGDAYASKLINLSNLNPELISPDFTKSLVEKSISQHYKTSSEIPSGIFSTLSLYIKRSSQSKKIVKNKRYDLAIACTPFIYDLIPLAKSKAKTKAVILYHVIPKRKATNLSNAFRFSLANIENKISFNLIRKHADIILTGNEVEKKKLENIFPGKKIIIAHAGLDTEKINIYKKHPKDPNLALFAGRLTTQKGILDLVDIMKSLSKNNSKLKLVILGDGPDKEELKSRISKEKIKSISLKGFVSEKEKYQYLSKAKYFFFPSYEEGWGIALAEALYLNCQSICYELPHYKSIFSNYPNYIQIGNISKFSETFEKIKGSNPNSKQASFMKKYTDKKVISDVIKQIL